MNARASGNYLAISSKSVEIFWAEIYWGRNNVSIGVRVSYLCLRENQMHKSLDYKQELLTRTRLLGIITDDTSQGKIIFLQTHSGKIIDQSVVSQKNKIATLPITRIRFQTKIKRRYCDKTLDEKGR
jgi:hypothetical protein